MSLEDKLRQAEQDIKRICDASALTPEEVRELGRLAVERLREDRAGMSWLRRIAWRCGFRHR